MLRLSELFSSGAANVSGIGNNSIFVSPLWTSIITTVIILCIVWFIMHNEVDPRYEDTTFLTLVVKIGVWSFIAVGAINFISHGAIENSVSSLYQNKNQKQTIEKITDNQSIDYTGSIKPE